MRTERNCYGDRVTPPPGRAHLFNARHGKTHRTHLLSRGFFVRRTQAGGGTTMHLTKLRRTRNPGRVERSDSAGVAVLTALAQNRHPPAAPWQSQGRTGLPQGAQCITHVRPGKVYDAWLPTGQNRRTNGLPQSGGHKLRELSLTYVELCGWEWPKENPYARPAEGVPPNGGLEQGNENPHRESSQQPRPPKRDKPPSKTKPGTQPRKARAHRNGETHKRRDRKAHTKPASSSHTSQTTTTPPKRQTTARTHRSTSNAKSGQEPRPAGETGRSQRAQAPAGAGAQRAGTSPHQFTAIIQPDLVAPRTGAILGKLRQGHRTEYLFLFLCWSVVRNVKPSGASGDVLPADCVAAATRSYLKTSTVLCGCCLARVFFSKLIYTHALAPNVAVLSLAAFLVLSYLEEHDYSLCTG